MAAESEDGFWTPKTHLSTGRDSNGNFSGQGLAVTEQNLGRLDSIQSGTHRHFRHHSSAQQSTSVPNTPFVRANDPQGKIRSPSPIFRTTKSTSPRAARSESEATLRPLPTRMAVGGCRYETGIKRYNRRMPYTIGSDKLESSPTKVKKHLDKEEEKRLTSELCELYGRLQPTADSEDKRARFVEKLETLLTSNWPDESIKVHVFGSSGNSLFTNDSDVDICITTKTDVLKQTCLLAKALADAGMQHIECRPNAKVPIVKMWDPVLKLACDMNVNNTAALNNTKMMRAYVDADPRVRPLAMIIKHWTKSRVLNDAALGGTLSSYTWLCMIVNFLQCRHPKILPSLQKEPFFIPTATNKNGFNDDPDATKDFGKQNRETLGELLFAFFRRYAHEIDFERSIISIREGGLISKQDKKWHSSQMTRLCVEEPFTTERNLANTADDTAARGLHLELRRAFDLISQGRLTECLEKFDSSTQEEQITQSQQHLFMKPTPQPRPTLTRSQSQTGSNRIPRSTDQKKAPQQGQNKRNVNSNRRASSAMPPHKLSVPQGAYYDLPVASGTQLGEVLAQHYQVLQQQEKDLRAKMHLNNATPINGLYTGYNNGNAFYHDAQMNGEQHRRHSNANRSPQVPLHQFTPFANMPGIASLLPQGFLNNPTNSPLTMTNPPSPSMSHAQLGHQGQTRRQPTIETNQYGSTRSQSQPPAQGGPYDQSGNAYGNDSFTPRLWQGGRVASHISLQDLQNDYLLRQQQRRYANDDIMFGVEPTRFESPAVDSSELDSASAQDDIASQADSGTDASASHGSVRSATLPHLHTVAWDYQHQRAARPRAASAIPPPGVRFFGDVDFDSDEPQRWYVPDYAVDQDLRNQPARRINGDYEGPLVLDGSEPSEYATPPDHFSDSIVSSSGRSSDRAMTSSPSALTPTQRPAELFVLDGTSEVPKSKVHGIQFGQFPARAPFRISQQSKSESNTPTSGAGRGLYSHTLSGLGISMSNGTAAKDGNLANGTSKQSPTVAGLNLASTLKPGSILSPVREVRTPSPTTRRDPAVLMQSIGGSNLLPRPVVMKDGPLSILAPGPKSYAKAHQRSRSVDKSQKRARSVDAERRPPQSKTSSASTSPAPVKTSASSKTQPSKSAPRKEAEPSKPQPSHSVQTSTPVQPMVQSGGWQQPIGSKKKKNTKKSASVGSIALPIDSERKGG